MSTMHCCCLRSISKAISKNCKSYINAIFSEANFSAGTKFTWD